MSEAVTKEMDKELYIFGNIHDEEIVFPDLTSPGSTAAFKMAPGDVVDLEDYFTSAKLRRSRSLKLALNSSWIKPCKSVKEEIITKKRQLPSGEAPLNEFDFRLAEELEKEAAEEARMKQGSVDTLGARARKALADQKQA